MKRDMELVRKILLAAEAFEEDPLDSVRPAISGYTDEQISCHIQLMDEAGLVVGMDSSTGDGHDWSVRRLTWRGYDFLDSIRDDIVWKTTKEGAKKVGGLAFDALVEYAKAVAKHELVKRTGLSLD